MKRIVLIGALALTAGAALAAGPALAQTTLVRTGSGTATITQGEGPARTADAPRSEATAMDTTRVRNGGSVATITQSGDPAQGVRRVERRDGHTRVEQRNGSNTAVITQDGPGSPSPLDADPFFRDDE